MISKKYLIQAAREGRITLPPLSFRVIDGPPAERGEPPFDLFLEASWKGRAVRLAAECRAASTPRAFRDGLNRLRLARPGKSWRPLLIMPFLREEQLRELEAAEISGVDLCGNGVVIVPGALGVFRGGNKNRFPASAPIKNIYRKNSSLAARVFLSVPVFAAVGDIRDEIIRRDPLRGYPGKKPISLATVSKVLKSLREDLVIERGEEIRLIQGDKLLDNLRDNYLPPRITGRVRLRVGAEGEELRELLGRRARSSGLPFAATGLSSAGRYAAGQRGDLLSLYCPDLSRLKEVLPGKEDDRFPDLEILETGEERAFFDPRREGSFFWSSPAQAYLELAAGDKRDRQTAEQVRALILEELEGKQP